MSQACSSISTSRWRTSWRRPTRPCGRLKKIPSETDVSPIGFAAELHLDINIHNYGAQEYMTHSKDTLEVFETSMTFENGFLHPGDKPGLGVEFHPEIAEKFPYEQAYLPYNRLADGTVHNW
ncbi:enolase C-terminal domain-like protein, partial [Corynebacterium pyruviciproducens]